VEIVGQVLIEFGYASLGEPFRRRTRAHPVFAAAGIVLLGGLAGAILSFLWPIRLFGPAPLRGASLFVSPLLAGVVMDRFGQWRERRGKPRSYLATFWGGALFAFTMALVRFLWVGR
jgi:hypothetical protein